MIQSRVKRLDQRKAALFVRLRNQMVEEQLVRRGIDDERVLAAMLQTPRHEFVPEPERGQAYSDWALPIGYGQTISQPYTVAYMLQALELCGTEKVLEIGTGSGYGAAILSQLANEVHTVERISELGWIAKQQLAQLGYANVHVHLGDGSLGLRRHAPFDAIVVTAAAETLPAPLREQLADGGRAVMPIGDRQTSQALCRFTKHGEQYAVKNLGGFAFVPLIGKHGVGRVP